MREKATSGNLSVRAISGTTNVMVAMDLADPTGCLGFSIERTDLGTPTAPLPEVPDHSRWLPSLLRFPDDADNGHNDTHRSPLQRFRWGDYTVEPGHRYRYRVVARGGAPDALTDLEEAVVEIQTEDPNAPHCSVFFNRGAAASQAYVRKFGAADPDKLQPAQREEALKWLSRGLEEAILAFLEKAEGPGWGLRAAIYEFQKPSLLNGLAQARDRGADVKAVYHGRQKTVHAPEDQITDREGRRIDPKDHTARDNVAAIHAAGIEALCTPRKADPQGAIMHNKFVVLLKDDQPVAVWTGSTNWTDGGIYGQLNVGHAVYEPEVAAKYLEYWQGLHDDLDHAASVANTGRLTPVPTKTADIPPGTTPMFSPHKTLDMIDLYAKVCEEAEMLLVCAPFELHKTIAAVLFEAPRDDQLRYILADTTKSIGGGQNVKVIDGMNGEYCSVATSLGLPLHDFQNRLLLGNESFHHKGIHIHSKISLADPLSYDPILVTGSANFSSNSTQTNDSNSLIVRGNTAVADIYLTEFMRLFDQYRFRDMMAGGDGKTPLGLATDDSWAKEYYAEESTQARDRALFAGTRSV